MNKKNVVFLVIDSLLYDKIFTNNSMPFLKKISKDAVINCSKMYSEASYTEAALVSLLGGVDTLKQGGYLKKLANKKTIMEVFQENGYHTFFNSYQPHVYPSKSYPGLSEYYYNVHFDINSMWSYRLEYYSNLYKNNNLNKKYYNLLIDILNDNFNAWIKMFEGFSNKTKEVSFIYQFSDLNDINEELDKLKKEYNKFNINKEKYLISLLEEGKKHSIFNIKTYKMNKLVSLDFRKKRYEKFNKTFKKIYFKNFQRNLLNNRPIITNPLKDKEKFLNYLRMYKNALFDKDLFDKIDYNKTDIKVVPSMYSHINNFCEWHDNYKLDKPFFAYMHLDDCHFPEAFYTYDVEDMNLLDKEFSKINEYLKKLPKNFKGALGYDLSLLYIDGCIGKLYKYLEKNNMFDNTILAITADHGYSYSFDPMHDTFVRNDHKENYHIPFILIDKNLDKVKDDGYHNSKDIPATIIDACKLKIPETYDGISLLKNIKNKDYVIIENVNGGCPDYNLREIMLGVRNDNYVVTMMFNMNKDFEDGKIISIYDLKKDKLEYHNLANNINYVEKTKKEQEIIKRYFIELKKDIEKNNFLKEK